MSLNNSEKQNFKVDIPNVINLLGQKLYSSNEVVIRELIQNAFDSIIKRYSNSFKSEGKIEISVEDDFYINISDNGIGMNYQDLDNYLSTIGKSLKVKQNNSLYIGEFGIGFFSAYMISENIKVITKKNNFKTCIWESTGIEGYSLKETDEDFQIGTKIILKLLPSSTNFSDVGFLKKVILKYTNFLDCKIYFNDQIINRLMFPWEEKTDLLTKESINLHFNTQVIYFKHFTLSNQNANLLLFLTKDKIRNEIYSKGLFVTNSYVEIIPKELDFINCIISSNTFKLDLARERILNNTYFHIVLGQIEIVANEWLEELLKSNKPDPYLVQILNENQEYFKRISLKKDQLFTKIYKFLKFPLINFDQKEITITDYLSLTEKYKEKVLFIEDNANEKNNLLITVCQKEKIPVFLIKNEKDKDLLRRISTKEKAVFVNLYDEKDNILNVENTNNLDNILTIFNTFLNYKIEIKNFNPSTIPFLINSNDLTINSNNHFLKELNNAKLKPNNRKDLYLEFFHLCEETTKIYFNDQNVLSRLLSNFYQLFRSKVELIQSKEKLEFEYNIIKFKWWEGPTPIDSFKGNKSFILNNKKYKGNCFIVCSFKPQYKDVIKIVTSVFEKFDILAETAEEINNISIMNKVCQKIDQCDFAIVDISENTPNVLLELGILIARKKPAIILKNTAINDFIEIQVPSDIISIERIEYQNVLEDLTNKLSNLFKRLTVNA